MTLIRQAYVLHGQNPTYSELGKLFLVVADTTNLVTDLRVEGLLLEGLVCAGSRPPAGGLFYRSLGGILHNRLT